MKPKTLFVSLGACVVLAGAAALLLTWTLPRQADTRVSLTLLGYTNDPTGTRTFGYAGSNVTHSGFAVLSARNPTGSHFACQGEFIPLRGSLYSAQMNKTVLNGRDFDLLPGASLTFAVPVPEAHGTWQCLLNLIQVRNYKHRWQFEADPFAQRLGLHFRKQGQVIFNREVLQ
jgi:hypothetical protein